MVVQIERKDGETSYANEAAVNYWKSNAFALLQYYSSLCCSNADGSHKMFLFV